MGVTETIRLWGTEREVEDGVVRVSQQLRVEQARQLQTLVPEALSIQEAIRMAVSQAMTERKQLASQSDLDEAVQALQRIDNRLADSHESE